MAEPLQGEVWRYDYLWRWQHDGGETEGRKARPTAMVAVVKTPDGTSLFILPITSLPPAAGRLSVEITQIERRRAGLDDIPLWIMIDEQSRPARILFLFRSEGPDRAFQQHISSPGA